MVAIVARFSFIMNEPNFFQGFNDFEGAQVTVQFNDPGTINGFALDDTLTVVTTFSNSSFAEVHNYIGLALDAANLPTAGQFTAAFASQTNLSTGVTRDVLSVTGLNWDAATMVAVGNTATSADDDALYASAFTGNDRFDLSDRRDWARGYEGRDRLTGNGGNDRLYGDSGADRLSGDDGDDALFGGAGGDRIDCGAGSDTVRGGGGADVFRFVTGDGGDVIADFTDGEDKIEILSGASDFAALFITFGGGDTLIRFADVTLTLTGIDASVIDAGDFIFH